MKNRGFTLVEIMLVIAIVALLSSMAIVEGVQLKKQANESNCLGNLKAIASGFEVYSARNSGLYAPSEQSNLQFLVDSSCLFQDLVSIGQIGNFRYTVGSVTPGGYEIRAMAMNPALANHNYEITTGGTLKRSDTAEATDTNFKDYR
ncbi:MAG: prepilin-type N-terminal cleavage/methylation domain-containing protein [Candidatus Omnitrophica bacterium]|nr:prepilin-type N-terminal cleavage/methylation domain-containing protein [Candidatus Omnitrophota bacterium]